MCFFIPWHVAWSESSLWNLPGRARADVAAGAHPAAARVRADALPPGAAEAAGFAVAPGRSGGMLVRTELPGAHIKLAVRLPPPPPPLVLSGHAASLTPY